MNVEFQLRKHQGEVFETLNRFNVLLAHRRFGKTVLAVIISVIMNLKCKEPNPQTHYFAPSYSQAKKVAWNYLKNYTRPMTDQFNESELKVTLPNKGVVQLGSADNPHSNRGIYSDYAILDEPALMPSLMFTEVLRPALSDRKGGMLMIGTPAGRNGLFYDKFQESDLLPDWNRYTYKASQTNIIDADELAAARRDMSKSEYEQEYECSWDAAIKGSYYGTTLTEDQITTLVHDPTKLVYCTFDLGMNDQTAVWFFQLDGEVIKCIEYQEYVNTGLPMIISDMRKRPYQYGAMVFPPDVKVRSLSTGKSRKETLLNLGVDVVVAPECKDLIGDIEHTRSFLPRLKFDREKCKHGIEALRQYRSDWIEKRNVLSLRPVHDWASHGASAMRYLATTGTAKLDTRGWSSALEYSETGRH